MDKISWETHEYIHTEKGSDWYWIVGMVTVTIAIISIILNNVIFAILIIVSSITLSLFASRRPKVVDVKIDNRGVQFGRTMYPFVNLESFWVETRDNFPRLLIKTKKIFMPLVVIHVDPEDEEILRSILMNYLKEEELSEPLLEKVMIYLGF